MLGKINSSRSSGILHKKDARSPTTLAEIKKGLQPSNAKLNNMNEEFSKGITERKEFNYIE